MPSSMDPRTAPPRRSPLRPAHRALWALLCVAATLVACGRNPQPPTTAEPADTAQDVDPTEDTTEDADAPEDTPPDAAEDADTAEDTLEDADAAEDVPPDVPPTCPSPLPCPEALTLCGASCVDLTTDATACGRCGTSCLDSAVCADGRCIPAVPPDGNPGERFGRPVPLEAVGGTFAIADIDGDGAIDVAIPLPTRGALEVVFSIGDPGAHEHVVVSVGNGDPSATVALDLDRDGDLDLATTMRGTGRIELLLNDGGRSFVRGQSRSVGGTPDTLHTEDFNRDAVPDLLVSNAAAGGFARVLGRPDGTLQPPTFVLNGTEAARVALGTLNADTWPDAVAVRSRDRRAFLVINRIQRFETSLLPIEGVDDVLLGQVDTTRFDELVFVGDGVRVLPNTGNGLFPEVVLSDIDQLLTRGALGDLTMDGLLDLTAWSPTTRALHLYAATGQDTFEPLAVYPLPPPPPDAPPTDAPPPFALYDADLDARVELLLADPSRPILWWVDHEDQRLVAPERTPLGGPLGAPIVATPLDFDGDGIEDLAIAVDDTVTFRRTTPAGRLVATATAKLPGAVVAMVALDQKGDRRPDLLVATAGQTTLTLLENRAHGTTWTLHRTLQLAATARRLVVARDADGPRLAVIAEDGQIDLYALPLAADALASPTALAVHPHAEAIALLDLNHDGFLDVAVAEPADDRVWVYLSTCGPELAAPTAWTVPSPTVLLPIDTDGDGVRELVIGGAEGAVHILRATGQTLEGQVRQLSGAETVDTLLPFDFDGDGARDLLIGSGPGRTLSLWLGEPQDPRGGWTAHRTLPATPGAAPLALLHTPAGDETLLIEVDAEGRWLFVRRFGESTGAP